mgnify:CR=1 FL=1
MISNCKGYNITNTSCSAITLGLAIKATKGIKCGNIYIGFVRTGPSIYSSFNKRPMNHGHSTKYYITETPLSKDDFCTVWTKLAQCFWRSGFLGVLNAFLLMSLWKKAWPFVWTKLDPYTRGACHFWLYIGCSGVEDFEICHYIFIILLFWSPWKWTCLFNE